MQLSQNAQVLDAVVRMVVPMRREFGCPVDVQAFMRDAAYAHQVLGQALNSQVERLRQYAEVAQRHLMPPENKPARTAAPAPMRAPAAAAAAAAAAAHAVAHAGFAAHRREAVQSLLALVGPMAEPLCIKMEKARTPADLAPLLILARQTVTNQRGVQAARDYLAAVGQGDPALA